MEEYLNMSAHGEIILPRYYDERINHRSHSSSFVPEMKIRNTEYKGIPIKGILDRVDVYKDYEEVPDYKTGKYRNARPRLKRPSEKNPVGGDCWRQIIFYKIPLDNDKKHNWQMISGFMDFVEPDEHDKLGKEKIAVSPEDTMLVGEEIEDSWTKIHNHDFENGCGEEDCRWCNFVKDDYVFWRELAEIDDG